MTPVINEFSRIPITDSTEQKWDVVYEVLDKCPLEGNQIDKRFFNEDGTPNHELLIRFEKVKKVASKVLNDEEVRYFIVGGVVNTLDKTEYNSDIDFCIWSQRYAQQEIYQTLTRREVSQEISVGLQKLRLKMIEEVNGKPLELLDKSTGFSDINLTAEAPCYRIMYRAVVFDNSMYFYDLDRNVWMKSSRVKKEEDI
jgi:hypothetical protein